MNRFYAVATSSGGEGVDPKSLIKKEKTSKAMRSYLERARQHDLFMKTEQEEFEIGKRHLANMMGEPAETYDNQEQIDVSFKQLLTNLFITIFVFFRKQFDTYFPQRFTIKEHNL